MSGSLPSVIRVGADSWTCIRPQSDCHGMYALSWALLHICVVPAGMASVDCIYCAGSLRSISALGGRCVLPLLIETVGV